jgi:hypothetical protein
MKSNPLAPDADACNPMQRCRMTATFAATILACSNPPRFVHADAENADGDVAAIWRIHQVEFVYHSANVYYACDSLEEKIGAILRAVGAHQRIIVDIGCANGDFVSFALVRLTLATPVEATPEAVAAATTFTSREQLIARVRNERPPTAADIVRFPARWQPVTLSRRAGLRLDSGDCELLKALGTQVFPRLSIRVERRRLRCVSSSKLRPRLEVVALMPTPAALRRNGGGHDRNSS